MDCVRIISKIKHNTNNFWKVQTFEKNSPKLIHSDEQVVCQNERYEYRSGTGIIIKYKKLYYVISCFHISKKSQDTCIYVKNTKNDKTYKFEAVKLLDCYELDISIFSVTDKDATLSKLSYLYDSLENPICISGDVIIKGLKKSIDNINLNKEVLNTTIVDTVCDICSSSLFPPVPMIAIKYIEGIDKETSGAPVFQSNKLIGIISHYNNNTNNVLVLPTYYIKYLIELINKKIYDKTLKTIYLDTNICTLETVKGTENLLMINDNYNISYPGKKQLKNNHFIKKLNNMPFNNDGKVFCNKTKIWIPLNTYILLHNDCDIFKFNIVQIENETCKESTVNINPLQVIDASNINIYTSDKFLIWNNLVFTELSEELLIDYNNKGISIIGTSCTKFKNYTGKTIVLIDIIYKDLDDDIKKIYDSYGLPLVNENGRNYYLPYVSKINNKKIDSLETMEKVLQTNEIITINFELGNDKPNIKIKYET
jgi:hypothetical protein